MIQKHLFAPPSKPKAAIQDEPVAVKIVDKLIALAVDRWSFDRDEFSEQDKIELAEALMAEDSDNFLSVFRWLRNNRPGTEWKWEDKGMLLEAGLKEACESVLPASERRVNEVNGG